MHVRTSGFALADDLPRSQRRTLHGLCAATLTKVGGDAGSIPKVEIALCSEAPDSTPLSRCERAMAWDSAGLSLARWARERRFCLRCEDNVSVFELRSLS